jgi:hypothetical protein
VIRAATRRVAHGFAYLIFGLAALSVIGLWRLASGPVELGFLRPLADQTIQTPEGPIRFSAGQVLLVWSGWQTPLQIRLADVRATDGSGQDIAVIPQASGNISLRSMLSGRVGITEIVVPRVRFHAAVSGEGMLSLAPPVAGESDASSRAIGLFIEQLLADLNDDHPLGRLSQVIVEHASATIYDRATGFIWNAPAASATLERDAQGVRIRGALRLDVGGSSTQARIEALYRKVDRRIEAELKVEEFRPSVFAGASRELAPLARFDLPMNGVVSLVVNGAGAIERLDLDVKSGAGQLAMTGILPRSLAVRESILKAKVDPVGRRLVVAPLRVQFDGPALEINASFRAPSSVGDTSYTADVSAMLVDLPTSRLGEFWPEVAAPGGRGWVLDNISDGWLDKAIASVRLEGALGSVTAADIKDATGELHYRDVSVRYLDGMSPVRGVSGAGRYESGRLRLTVNSGSVDEIRVATATIDILGLDADQQRAQIEISVAGSAPAALALLAQPRLGLPRDLLFDPKRAQGEVKADVSFKFPLIAALTMDQVVYATHATIYGGALQQVVAGLSLTESTASLDLSSAELSVSGRGKLDGQDVDFSWREMFGEKPAFRRRYQATPIGSVTVPWVLKVLGNPGWSTYLGGAVSGDIVWQTPVVGPSELVARVNLKTATLAAPEIGWQKVSGVDGRATIVARFPAGASAPTTVTVDAQAADLTARGTVDVTGGQFRSVAFSKFALGRNDVVATLARTPSGFSVDLRGAAFDLAPILALLQKAPASSPQAAPSPSTGPIIALTVDLSRVLLERGVLGPVRGSLGLRGEFLTHADMAFSAGGASMTVALAPHADGRSLRVSSDDVGSMLRSAGWINGIVGGKLTISGQYTDGPPGTPLRARVRLEDFRLAKVSPSATQVPDLNALSSLAGSEPTFKLLEAQLRQTGSAIELREGRAHGTSLGMTAEGKIDARLGTIALQGTVVPGYVVNNLLSNIPLIGDILVGGKGGGLVAISFSVQGPLDQPKVSVNPLSALAIGPLRLIFRGATSDDANEAEKALGGPERQDGSGQR